MFTSAAWNKVKSLDVLPLPIGNKMTGGSLMGSPAVYLVYDGMKYHINDPDTFNGCNFNWSVIKTDAASLSTLKAAK